MNAISTIRHSCSWIQITSATPVDARREVTDCWQWYASSRQRRRRITMSYQQLTEGKRYQIAALIAQGLRPSEIARIINVHRSTVYRELKRNRRERQYFRHRFMLWHSSEGAALPGTGCHKTRSTSLSWRYRGSEARNRSAAWATGLECPSAMSGSIGMWLLTRPEAGSFERRLNLRPRKYLGFKQPEAILRELVQAAQGKCRTSELNSPYRGGRKQ